MTPVWVDADVLLRLLTNDPPWLAEKAAALAEKPQRGQVLLRLSTLVVAEIVWVLVSYYGYSKRQVADALIPLILADGVDARRSSLLF